MDTFTSFNTVNGKCYCNLINWSNSSCVTSFNTVNGKCYCNINKFDFFLVDFKQFQYRKR